MPADTVELMKRKGTIAITISALMLAGCGGAAASSYETPGEISEQLHSEGIAHTLDIDEHGTFSPTLRFDGSEGMHFIWLDDRWSVDEIIDSLEPGETASYGDDWLIQFDETISGDDIHVVSDALGGSITVG